MQSLVITGLNGARGGVRSIRGGQFNGIRGESIQPVRGLPLVILTLERLPQNT